jgi:FkbM family methyltransferase
VRAAAPRSGPRPVTVGGRRIFVDDDQPTFWDRVEAGRWEPGSLRALDACLGPDIVFVDVGAWVGALTLYAAALGARVFAVEADPKALDQLRRNLSANPSLNAQVSVVPRALSADLHPLRLGARRNAGDSMSSALLADGPTWTAESTTPGSLSREIGSEQRRFVKLDIEGGEYAVLPTIGPLLENASGLLLALHPDILAASGERDVAAATRRALGPLHGWTCARIEPFGPTPASLAEVQGAGPAEWLFTRDGHGSAA